MYRLLETVSQGTWMQTSYTQIRIKVILNTSKKKSVKIETENSKKKKA